MIGFRPQTARELPKLSKAWWSLLHHALFILGYFSAPVYWNVVILLLPCIENDCGLFHSRPVANLLPIRKEIIRNGERGVLLTVTEIATYSKVWNRVYNMSKVWNRVWKIVYFTLLGVGYEILLITILQNMKHEKKKQGGKRGNMVKVSDNWYFHWFDPKTQLFDW